MQYIGSGHKRRVYFSASQRRAVAYAVTHVRCPSCNRQRIHLAGSRSVMCWECGWWGVLGVDAAVSFVVAQHQGRNRVTRVDRITLFSGQVLYQRVSSIS